MVGSDYTPYLTASQRLGQDADVVQGVLGRSGQRQDERVRHQRLTSALREELRHKQEHVTPDSSTKFVNITAHANPRLELLSYKCLLK